MRTEVRERNYFAVLLVATILLGASALAESPGKVETFSGSITCSLCGANHKMMTYVPEKDCVTSCVKLGVKFSLVVGKKVYELVGKESDVEKYADARVIITGTIDRKHIRVISVEPA